MNEFVFRKGEYRLPRNVCRWLIRRMAALPQTRRKLCKAIEVLATIIGRYHTGPKVRGREFGLCRLKLKDKHPNLTDWLVREATAFLHEWGFIKRVTPKPTTYREIAGHRFGYWPKAKFDKSSRTFRSPPVQWKITDALLNLFLPKAPSPQGGNPRPPQGRALSVGVQKGIIEQVVLPCGGAQRRGSPFITVTPIEPGARPHLLTRRMSFR